ncbi:hypothetical protein [Actinophytocola sp.]|uniref:hypothetical protein n=1 Tax=Actinophytocola sp. TaxID=1872138 RepID=UPI003D6A1DD9
MLPAEAPNPVLPQNRGADPDSQEQWAKQGPDQGYAAYPALAAPRGQAGLRWLVAGMPQRAPLLADVSLVVRIVIDRYGRLLGRVRGLDAVTEPLLVSILTDKVAREDEINPPGRKRSCPETTDDGHITAHHVDELRDGFRRPRHRAHDPLTRRRRGHTPVVVGNARSERPARFRLDDKTLNHWFDGLAMLHKFDLADGPVG